MRLQMRVDSWSAQGGFAVDVGFECDKVRHAVRCRSMLPTPPKSTSPKPDAQTYPNSLLVVGKARDEHIVEPGRLEDHCRARGDQLADDHEDEAAGEGVRRVGQAAQPSPDAVLCATGGVKTRTSSRQGVGNLRVWPESKETKKGSFEEQLLDEAAARHFVGRTSDFEIPRNFQGATFGF